MTIQILAEEKVPSAPEDGVERKIFLTIRIKRWWWFSRTLRLLSLRRHANSTEFIDPSTGESVHWPELERVLFVRACEEKLIEHALEAP